MRGREGEEEERKQWREANEMSEGEETERKWQDKGAGGTYTDSYLCTHTHTGIADVLTRKGAQVQRKEATVPEYKTLCSAASSLALSCLTRLWNGFSHAYSLITWITRTPPNAARHAMIHAHTR